MGQLPISIVLQIPPPDGPTACSDGDTGPRPRRTKAAPRKRRTAHRPAPTVSCVSGVTGPLASWICTDKSDACRDKDTPVYQIQAAPKISCKPAEDLMQTRNRLRICSCPAHALPVLLIPPPGGPTACPEGGSRPPDPGRIKAAPQEAQDRPGTAPQLLEDLGPIGGIQQPEGNRRPRSSSRHCRASDPGRPWKSCQTRNRLRFWFCK